MRQIEQMPKTNTNYDSSFLFKKQGMHNLIHLNKELYVIELPNACMASLHRNSRTDERMTAFPSPLLE